MKNLKNCNVLAKLLENALTKIGSLKFKYSYEQNSRIKISFATYKKILNTFRAII